MCAVKWPYDAQKFLTGDEWPSDAENAVEVGSFDSKMCMLLQNAFQEDSFDTNIWASLECPKIRLGVQLWCDHLKSPVRAKVIPR